MFRVKNELWNLKFVPYKSHYLRRSDGSYTIGMTNDNTKTVYVCDNLSDEMTEKVLCHEICHCICFSYDIVMPIDEEERLCQFVSEHGREVFAILDMILYRNMVV